MVVFVPTVEVCGSPMGFSDGISGITRISDYLKMGCIS